MKTAESSVTRALRRGALARLAPRAVAGDRLDLVLPHGWPESGAPVLWRWRRGGRSESGAVQDLASLPAGARAVAAHVWTPAAETMLTRATLPTRSPRKIRQALPYALEDRIVGEPESLHFAWRNEPDGSLSVAVTARARLEAWRERLGQAGVRVATLCPATLFVPWALDCWSLGFVGNELLVRTGAVSGFVCPASIEQPPALLAAALREALTQPGAPETLVVFQPPKGFVADSWASALELPVRVEPTAIWDRHDDPKPALDLLQATSESAMPFGAALRPYRTAFVLLLVWLVAQAAADTAAWWKLRREQSSLRETMTSILLTSFPETRAVLDPAAQMQRNMDALLARSGRGDREFLPLLAKSASVLRSAPQVRLRGLSYADQALTLELTWATPATPDALRGALEAAGLRAEVLGLTPRSGEVDGRVRLQPQTAPRSGT